MYTLKGRYAEAKIYAKAPDQNAVSQVYELLEQPFSQGSKIRIMPDMHVGKGCVIGTTMTINDKVAPSLVGVDIGCGMEVARLTAKKIDFAELDDCIRENIPSGTNSRKKPHKFAKNFDKEELRCIKKIDSKKAELQIGTLGGGNHFIEIGGEKGDLYLIVHSGSRNLGNIVAEYYTNRARAIALSENIRVRRELAYLYGVALKDYLNDMKLMQKYADLNRKAIIKEITDKMGLEIDYSFTTVHNYISDDGILRKGAVSAKEGERLILPINMRDGSFICLGKGAEDWNYSAPHGAGRLLSRGEAKKQLNIKKFEETMKGVYTTCVHKSTLDESPFAYKPMEEILKMAADTITVEKRIPSLYNFKAG